MPRSLLYVMRVLLVIAVVVVTIASLRPGDSPAPEGWDKIGHAVAYFSVTFILVLSVRKGPATVARVAMLIGSAVAYGVLMEIVQHFVGRQFDLLDMAANAIGAIVGGGVGIAARHAIAARLRGDDSGRT